MMMIVNKEEDDDDDISDQQQSSSVEDAPRLSASDQKPRIKGRRVQRHVKKLSEFDNSDEEYFLDTSSSTKKQKNRNKLNGSSGDSSPRRSTNSSPARKMMIDSVDPNESKLIGLKFPNKLLNTGKILTHWNDSQKMIVDMKLIETTNSIISKFTSTIAKSEESSRMIESKPLERWSEDSNVDKNNDDNDVQSEKIKPNQLIEEKLAEKLRKGDVNKNEDTGILPTNINTNPPTKNPVADQVQNVKNIFDKNFSNNKQDEPVLFPNLNSWFSNIGSATKIAASATKIAASATMTHAAKQLANAQNILTQLPIQNTIESTLNLMEPTINPNKDNEDSNDKTVTNDDNDWNDNEWDDEPIILATKNVQNTETIKPEIIQQTHNILESKHQAVDPVINTLDSKLDENDGWGDWEEDDNDNVEIANSTNDKITTESVQERKSVEIVQDEIDNKKPELESFKTAANSVPENDNWDNWSENKVEIEDDQVKNEEITLKPLETITQDEIKQEKNDNHDVTVDLVEEKNEISPNLFLDISMNALKIDDNLENDGWDDWDEDNVKIEETNMIENTEISDKQLEEATEVEEIVNKESNKIEDQELSVKDAQVKIDNDFFKETLNEEITENDWQDEELNQIEQTDSINEQVIPNQEPSLNNCDFNNPSAFSEITNPTLSLSESNVVNEPPLSAVTTVLNPTLSPIPEPIGCPPYQPILSPWEENVCPLDPPPPPGWMPPIQVEEELDLDLEQPEPNQVDTAALPINDIEQQLPPLVDPTYQPPVFDPIQEPFLCICPPYIPPPSSPSSDNGNLSLNNLLQQPIVNSRLPLTPTPIDQSFNEIALQESNQTNLIPNTNLVQNDCLNNGDEIMVPELSMDIDVTMNQEPLEVEFVPIAEQQQPLSIVEEVVPTAPPLFMAEEHTIEDAIPEQQSLFIVEDQPKVEDLIENNQYENNSTDQIEINEPLIQSKSNPIVLEAANNVPLTLSNDEKDANTIIENPSTENVEIIELNNDPESFEPLTDDPIIQSPTSEKDFQITQVPVIEELEEKSPESIDTIPIKSGNVTEDWDDWQENPSQEHQPIVEQIDLNSATPVVVEDSVVSNVLEINPILNQQKPIFEEIELDSTLQVEDTNTGWDDWADQDLEPIEEKIDLDPISQVQQPIIQNNTNIGWNIDGINDWQDQEFTQANKIDSNLCPEIQDSLSLDVDLPKEESSNDSVMHAEPIDNLSTNLSEQQSLPSLNLPEKLLPTIENNNYWNESEDILIESVEIPEVPMVNLNLEPLEIQDPTSLPIEHNVLETNIVPEVAKSSEIEANAVRFDQKWNDCPDEDTVPVHKCVKKADPEWDDWGEEEEEEKLPEKEISASDSLAEQPQIPETVHKIVKKCDPKWEDDCNDDEKEEAETAGWNDDWDNEEVEKEEKPQEINVNDNVEKEISEPKLLKEESETPETVHKIVKKCDPVWEPDHKCVKKADPEWDDWGDEEKEVEKPQDNVEKEVGPQPELLKEEPPITKTVHKIVKKSNPKWEDDEIVIDQQQKPKVKSHVVKKCDPKWENDDDNDGWDDWGEEQPTHSTKSNNQPVKTLTSSTTSTNNKPKFNLVDRFDEDKKTKPMGKPKFAVIDDDDWNDDWNQPSISFNKPINQKSSYKKPEINRDNVRTTPATIAPTQLPPHKPQLSSSSSIRDNNYKPQPINTPLPVSSSSSMPPSVGGGGEFKTALKTAAVTTITHAVKNWSFNPVSIFDTVVDNLSNVVGVPSAEEMASLMKNNQNKDKSKSSG